MYAIRSYYGGGYIPLETEIHVPCPVRFPEDMKLIPCGLHSPAFPTNPLRGKDDRDPFAVQVDPLVSVEYPVKLQ